MRVIDLINVLKPEHMLRKVLQIDHLFAGNLVHAHTSCEHKLTKAMRAGNTEAETMMVCLEKRITPIIFT